MWDRAHGRRDRRGRRARDAPMPLTSQRVRTHASDASVRTHTTRALNADRAGRLRGWLRTPDSRRSGEGARDCWHSLSCSRCRARAHADRSHVVATCFGPATGAAATSQPRDPALAVGTKSDSYQCFKIRLQQLEQSCVPPVAAKQAAPLVFACRSPFSHAFSCTFGT